MEGTVSILEGLAALPATLDALGARRVLVITTPGRRFLDRLPALSQTLTVFDGATVHVPRATVDAAEAALLRSQADTLLSLGGGSATGLAKALRLTHDVRFVAIPTTYAGSEMTRLYGITDGARKETGRDARVRPDRVIHAPELFLELPRQLTATSLLNALAHPISALSRGGIDESTRALALAATKTLSFAMEQLLEAPASREGRRAALAGAARAGEVIDRAELGAHHQAAHLLGGRFGLEHAALHAVLLPHSVALLAAADPHTYALVAEAAGHADLPAHLYDVLTRAGAPRSLAELGVPHDALEAGALETPLLGEAWILDAQLGRRPSTRTRRWPSGTAARPPTSVRGPEPAAAARVVIALHGRGANADRFLKDALDLTGRDPRVTVIAPQAPRNSWYAKPYRAALGEHGADLSDSLAFVRALIDRVLTEVPAERVFLVGFSQGACLAAELFASSEVRLGGLVALSGARIGPPGEAPRIETDLTGARVVMGVAEADPHLDAADVRATSEAFRAAGASVELASSTGGEHVITARQRVLAHEAIHGASARAGQAGFGNAHAGEALAGALPLHQNSPRHAAYGLYAEQVNGTGFTAPRRDNVRCWLYRIRPSAQHTPFAPLAHPTLLDDWDAQPPEPNLVGLAPLPPPAEPRDFVDGLATFGGAGHPRLRRGYAMHLYSANRSMEHRAFYDADGDLLIIPQEGTLTLRTELGVLDVGPGQLALVPRGLKVSVHLHGGFARGYVGEVYGRHFELPERGPVGSNALTDRRHFRAPTALFEDRIDPGYRVTVKHGNRLFEATQDHSPYDVVAWHGDYVPYVYDLRDFVPVGTTRVDHVDPSAYLVIGAPLDEAGASSLDLVFFPPRWDVSEHTFRPPYFHRNATTELNGIIADPSLSPSLPFAPGCTFLTPSMTAHGVLTRAVESALRPDDVEADAPVRVPDGSMWFQLEAALPLGLTSWARSSEARIADWPSVWGAYRVHFDG